MHKVNLFSRVGDQLKSSLRLVLPLLVAVSLSSSTQAADVLFVGGGATDDDFAQWEHDGFVFEHLTNLGHNVTYLEGAESQADDAEDVDLLVISSTLGSGSVRGKFHEISTPILQWEEALLHIQDGNFAFTELGDDANNGTDAPVSEIVITNPEHPLAAGFPAGELEIADEPIAMPFIRLPTDSVINIASHIDFADDVDEEEQRLVLTAIEAGSEYADGETAQANIVNFPIQDAHFGFLNADGLKLFDNAIAWLLGETGGDPGDFDADGDFDVDDINALTTESAAGTNNADFDLTGDGVVNDADVTAWAKDIANTWIGDANVDGEFNSGDFVQVFSAGKFEENVDANWADGDWNGDGRFNSGDFVAAFSDGGFELGPRPAAASAVPEPGSLGLLLIGLLSLTRFRRR